MPEETQEGRRGLWGRARPQFCDPVNHGATLPHPTDLTSLTSHQSPCCSLSKGNCPPAPHTTVHGERAYHVWNTRKQALPVSSAKDRGVWGELPSQLQAVPKWVWAGQTLGQLGSSFREEVGIWAGSGSRKHLGTWPRDWEWTELRPPPTWA